MGCGSWTWRPWPIPTSWRSQWQRPSRAVRSQGDPLRNRSSTPYESRPPRRAVQLPASHRYLRQAHRCHLAGSPWGKRARHQQGVVGNSTAKLSSGSPHSRFLQRGPRHWIKARRWGSRRCNSSSTGRGLRRSPANPRMSAFRWMFSETTGPTKAGQIGLELSSLHQPPAALDAMIAVLYRLEARAP